MQVVWPTCHTKIFLGRLRFWFWLLDLDPHNSRPRLYRKAPDYSSWKYVREVAVFWDTHTCTLSIIFALWDCAIPGHLNIEDLFVCPPSAKQWCDFPPSPVRSGSRLPQFLHPCRFRRGGWVEQERAPLNCSPFHEYAGQIYTLADPMGKLLIFSLSWRVGKT